MKKTISFITENFNKSSPDLVGGFQGFQRAINMEKEDIIQEIVLSGLKGRGGAKYPTGKKLMQSAEHHDKEKYIICNADEGEPGTFKDRELLLHDPYGVFEGMLIAAFAINASHGILYLREEYKYMIDDLKNALNHMRSLNLLGDRILKTELSFDISIFLGAGAYICGEETSLIESMEGKPGRPRIKPPYTLEKGLFSKPTLVNNVATFSTISAIIRNGYEEFIKYGTVESPGTKLISLCGNVNKPGAYEVPFGMTIREIIYDIGEGIRNGNSFKFAQIGGVSGPLVLPKHIDTPFSYEDLNEIGVPMGSGAIIVVDSDNDILDYLDAVQAFFKHESCGKCTPCREGNRQLLNILSRLREGKYSQEDTINIEKIAKTMKYASFCGLGQSAPAALLSAIEHCPQEIFKRRD